MVGKAFLTVCASALLPAAAHAASVTVVGQNAQARACFLAADRESGSTKDLAACNRAIDSELLNQRDLIATLVNRGIVNFRMQRFDAAISDFDRVLASQPGQPDALINKGITLLASDGDLATAMEMLDTGLAGKPQRPWVGYYGRGVAHELAGRDAEAFRDYKQAQALKPGWRAAEEALSRFSAG